LTTCDNHGCGLSHAIALCNVPSQIAITGPGGVSSSMEDAILVASSSVAIVVSSTNETVFASRGAARNSRAELTSVISEESCSRNAGVSRSDIQRIDLTITTISLPGAVADDVEK